jgi:hypothetical protein
MGNGNVRQQDGESGQNSLLGTKRYPGSYKRFLRQRIDEFATSTDGVNPGDSEAGTGGNYVVKLADGTKDTVQGAICIRVLQNGELNLLTDDGQWFLFARGAWTSASPEQPSPHVSARTDKTQPSKRDAL